jgi:hypothetical protein
MTKRIKVDANKYRSTKFIYSSYLLGVVEGYAKNENIHIWRAESG